MCEWRSPEDLLKLLDLDLREGGEEPARTLQHCRDAIHYSVKTSKTPTTTHHTAGLKWKNLEG